TAVQGRPRAARWALVAAGAERLGQPARQLGGRARVARGLAVAQLERADEQRDLLLALPLGGLLFLRRQRQRQLRLLARQRRELGGAAHDAAELVDGPGLDEHMVDVGVVEDLLRDLALDASRDQEPPRPGRLQARRAQDLD